MNLHIQALVLFSSLCFVMNTPPGINYENICGIEHKISMFLQLNDSTCAFWFSLVNINDSLLLCDRFIKDDGKLSLKSKIKGERDEMNRIIDVFTSFMFNYKFNGASVVNQKIQITHSSGYANQQISYVVTQYSQFSNKTLKEYPILNVIKQISGSSKYFEINSFIQMKSVTDYSTFVFSDYKEKIIAFFDTKGVENDRKSLEFTPKAGVIEDIQTKDQTLVTNISLYLSFERVFAFYEITLKEDNNSNKFQIESIERRSKYRENKVWFGCETSLCLNARINAITYSMNQNILIFVGEFYLEWDPLTRTYPKEDKIKLLKPEFQYIDSAFMDTKTFKLFVIKGEKIMDFNNNNFIESVNISQIFSGFNQKVDAVSYDLKSNEIHLFSDDTFWIYSRKSDNSYTFKAKQNIEESNHPKKLNSILNEENGDHIYIKNNYIFWKEYGIMRKQSLQTYIFCSDSFYKELDISDLKTHNDFKKDLNIYDKIDFKEKPISKPTPPPPPKDEPTTQNNGTENSSSSKIPEEETTIKLWHILFLIFFGALFLIFCVTLCYFCGFFFGRKKEESVLTRRRKLRERLDSVKQQQQHIH